jgi:hypothetical protein
LYFGWRNAETTIAVSERKCCAAPMTTSSSFGSTCVGWFV